jgi:hypothetical protein
MGVSRRAKILRCVMGAALLTAAAYFADARSSANSTQDSALRWARQIASQAEGMVFAARQKGEDDPVAWAVGYLTQGTEPRVMRITRWQGPVGESLEDFTLDAAAGLFVFNKVFSPEDGAGVRIQIQTEPTGFLGTHGTWLGDLYIAVFFALSLGSLLALFGAPQVVEFEDVRPQIRAWLKDAKGVLIQLGVHIREMVREAQNLAVAAQASRGSLEQLRERIHGGIREVRDARTSLNEAEHATLIAEVLALNLMIAAEKSGDDSTRGLGETAEELHRSIQKVRKLHFKSDAFMGKVELGLEPMATDADLAYHAYDGVFGSAEKMQAHIKKTTETLLGQAKMIQNLNGDLAQENETGAVTPKSSSGRR